MLPAPTGLRSQQNGGPGCSLHIFPVLSSQEEMRDGKFPGTFPFHTLGYPTRGSNTQRTHRVEKPVGVFCPCGFLRSSPSFSNPAQRKGKVEGFCYCFRTEPSDSGPLLRPEFSLQSPTFASRRRFLNSNSSTDLLYPDP